MVCRWLIQTLMEFHWRKTTSMASLVSLTCDNQVVAESVLHQQWRGVPLVIKCLE